MHETDEILMQNCLDLAKQAFGATRSNPMVGAILTYNGHIVSRGLHKIYGQAHAEVNAINALSDKEILKDCTLYVNLEPCSHQGQTPPCADLIIRSGIKKIIIGASDPNPKVAGDGIKRLIAAGCTVKAGILEKQCRELNKRFYTFHEKKRPWILLKWAQSSDGFIARDAGKQVSISCQQSQALVHQWRTQEMSILVGTNTASGDNPRLTARLHRGTNPTRIVLDRNLRLPVTLNIFDNSSPTILFTERKSWNLAPHVEVISVNFDNSLLNSICYELHARKIISCLIEGGAQTLNYWINSNLWDEARVFEAPLILHSGIKAPTLDRAASSQEIIDEDKLIIYSN